MNVTITVPPLTAHAIQIELQALVATFLRQHHTTTPCVVVVEKPDDVESFLNNPHFMREAPVYEVPRPDVVAVAPRAPDATVSDEVTSGVPVSTEPSVTSFERQAPPDALPKS